MLGTCIKQCMRRHLELKSCKHHNSMHNAFSLQVHVGHVVMWLDACSLIASYLDNLRHAMRGFTSVLVLVCSFPARSICLVGRASLAACSTITEVYTSASALV